MDVIEKLPPPLTRVPFKCGLLGPSGQIPDTYRFFTWSYMDRHLPDGEDDSYDLCSPLPSLFERLKTVYPDVDICGDILFIGKLNIRHHLLVTCFFKGSSEK